MTLRNFMIFTLLTFLLIALFAPGVVSAFYMGGEKPLGLAGAYTAVADDSSAIFMNPAGLSQAPAYIFTIDYEIDKKYDSNLWGVSLMDSSTGSIAAGFAYYKLIRDHKLSEVERLTNVSELSDEEEVFALAISEMYAPGFLFGISAKYYKQRSPNVQDYTGDIGILYFFSPQLKLGLTGRNLIKNDISELHKMFAGGVAYSTNFGLGVSFDLTKDADTDKKDDTIYSIGVQLVTPDAVMVRAGYMTDKIVDKRYYSFNVSYMGPDYSLGYAVMKDEADKNDIIQNISLKLMY